MNPIVATEIAYKNGYAAGRESALRTAPIYALSEDEHITRCAKCKSQLIFNYLHVKVGSSVKIVNFGLIFGLLWMVWVGLLAICVVKNAASGVRSC